MTESGAYARRGYSGAAAPSSLSSGITASQNTIDGTDLSTWAGVTTNGPARATISDGTSEEEIEFTGVSGNQLTGVTRGVGGTTGAVWSSGASLEHTSSQRDFDEANRIVYKILGSLGTAYQALLVNSGATDVTWGASLASLLTAGGDLPYASAANTPARLAKGAANQALLMNSGATAPTWAASLQSLLTAQGDLPYASAANTPARLAKGTAMQRLRINAGATAPEWAGQVGARCKHSTSQSITTSGTYQAVIFDTEEWDTDAIHSTASNTSRFVVPTGMGGKWFAVATLYWATNATGARLGQFKINGTTLVDGGYSSMPASATAASQAGQSSAVMNLSAADFVEVMAYQTSGGALNLGATDTAMSFIYLGP